MIGVAISTHQRPGVLARSLAMWAQAMPDLLVVTHDVAGDGVAVTKNRGITALMDAGCTELFLADDDVWPVDPHWATPYTTSSQPHLMHCWGRSRYIGQEDDITVWSWPRGVLLYARREVIDAVGGMRVEFGRWGGEHAEWSRRIHNAGFTRYPFADAASAREGVWHAEDYTRAVPSTITEKERNASTAQRHELYNRFRGTANFVEFRADRRSAHE